MTIINKQYRMSIDKYYLNNLKEENDCPATLTLS